MTDFAIANDGDGWDLVIEDGDLVLTHTLGRAAEVAQRVVYRVMTWLGESPYDRRAGQPYLDGIFGDEPVEGVVALLLQEIADVEGVDEIVEDPTFELGDDRTLSITVTIRVADEDVAIALEISP